jgi:histidine triad (HIT) family protein
MLDCLFCKIVKHEIPATIVYEDNEVIAFHDIHPAADVHILIVPKQHIATIMDMGESDEKIVGHLLSVSKHIAENKGLKGYKLSFNVGKEGGQVVMHIHLHLLGGVIRRKDY